MGTLDQIKDLSSSFMEFGKSTASNIQTSNDQNDRILADPNGEGSNSSKKISRIAVQAKEQ
jgi:conjugal transfer mating pair stabilization protein TraG